MFDVDWDVALSYQFLKCLQVTLQTSLKYYPGTLIAAEEGGNPVERERVQFKCGFEGRYRAAAAGVNSHTW